ncbi:hypothetical protein BsWGS_16379 [Bradybaena similaris]
MAATVSFLILLLTLSRGFAAEPGMTIKTTTKGIDYANQIAGNALRSKLQTITLPDQSGSEGSKSWSITNIRINGITGPDTHISLNPGAGGVTLGISNFGASLHADWRARYRIIFKVSSSGSVDLSVSGASITLVAALGEKNGRPSIVASSCTCNIPDIGIKFHGGLAAVILNIFRGVIRNKVRGLLQDEVCKAVVEQVNTRADAKLAEMKVTVEIAKKFVLDYGLIRAPAITSNYIELANRGLVYWKNNRQESTFTSAPCPPVTEFSNMLYLCLNEFPANTFAYVAHVNNFLQYNITVDKIPVSSQLLDPTGQLQTEFPSSKLEIRISSAAAPSVKFENQKVTVAAAANVDVVVHSQSSVVTPLQLRVSVSVTVQPSIVDGKLAGIITAYTFNISVRKSDLANINEAELNALIRQAIDEVVLPQINEIGRQGIELPSSGVLRFRNTRLNVQLGVLKVATDAEFMG